MSDHEQMLSSPPWVDHRGVNHVQTGHSMNELLDVVDDGFIAESSFGQLVYTAASHLSHLQSVSGDEEGGGEERQVILLHNFQNIHCFARLQNQ